MTRPVFRFAPSPNGRLHLGHAASALLNDALARNSDGQLLLRIEDIDSSRCRPDLVAALKDDLAWLGLRFEAPVRRQSAHLGTYWDAIAALAARELAYPCFCSRGDIATMVAAEAERDGEPPGRDPDGAPLYPGRCRRLPPAEALARRAAGAPHTWRLDTTRALAASPGPHAVRAFTVAVGGGGGFPGTGSDPWRSSPPIPCAGAIR